MLEPKDEVKQKLDIADVIGEYIQLKPAGSGSFKGLCPFHAERTPSFHVSRERQIWHCFGCDKGGDMFAFVMEMEGMPFPEALRHLARRAGVEVPEFRPAPKQVTDAKTALLAVHALAQKFYAKVLGDHPEAATARAYLAKRGITPELIAKFGLGYAPDRWGALVTFLQSRGYAPKDIVDAGYGIHKKNGDGLLDRFRHRVMIPLSDPVGNVVGFTGRMFAPGNTVTPEAPKYMNSPESPVYRKGEILYGLHVAKTGIRSAKCVIVVEGNLDVVSSHKAGVEHIVASSGTALTEMQLRLLARYTKTIVFALDEDAAGFAAARRAFDIARAKFPELAVRCLIIPKDAGKDADEVVQKDPAAWERIAAQSKEIIDFMFDRQLKQYEAAAGSATIGERLRLVDELLDELARIPRAADRHLHVLRLSDATHIPAELINAEIAKKSPQPTPRPPSAQSAQPERIKRSQADRAAEFIVGLMCRDETLVPELSERLPQGLLPDPWGRLYNLALGLYATPQIGSSAANHTLFSRLQTVSIDQGNADDAHAAAAALVRLEELVAALPPHVMRAELDRHIAIFTQADVTARRRRLEAAIREAELSGSPHLQVLLEEYARLLAKKSGDV